MLKFFQSFVIILIISTSGYAQATTSADSLNQINGCYDIFTLAQQMPNLKISKAAYEDSLTAYLKAKNSLADTGQITIRLTISKSGNVIDVEKVESTLPDSKAFIDAFSAFSSVWTAGKQNGHLICVYRKLMMNLTKEKALITILQL